MITLLASIALIVGTASEFTSIVIKTSSLLLERYMYMYVYIVHGFLTGIFIIENLIFI